MNLELIIQGHAENLISRSLTKALISDALTNDIKKINALMSAYDIGIIGTIENSYPLTTVDRSSLISKLTSQHNLQETIATWSVDMWLKIITPTVIKGIISARQKKEEESKIQSVEPIETNDADISEPSEAQPLTNKEDIVGYYTNVKLTKIDGKIFVPCGVGTTDDGFYICGIKEIPPKQCSAVYPLVYNYLIRNSSITEEDYPHYLYQINSIYQINYQRVFRLMVVILQLIKNAMVSRKLNVQYDGKSSELKLAVEILNDYIKRFSRLIGIEPPLLETTSQATNGIKISLDRKINGVFVENNHVPNNARELWYGEKINYRLSINNLSDLEYLLSEISPFDSFKEGQFTALTTMLNTNGHSMCIMPTGSGKSLIFYLASLLQPLPVLVISPTEILIEDQIRNLKKFHRIDNVSHLRLTSNNDFRDFLPCTSLMYLTPMTFQSINLLKKCRYINDGLALIMNKQTRILQETKISFGPSLSYIVLDEIHCISNWGHDFRPEYLMLSKFLNKFLSRVGFLGFTATANFSVVEDIQQQLSIPQHNIISPINFEKYNVSYDFRSVPTEEDMYMTTCEIVEKLISRGERTIIFTKNDEISNRLAEQIGYEADVFDRCDASAYHMFAEQKCKVLVASEELGIGINLPNIQNVIHFGLPTSKNEYVQEIGRAGRADESVSSFVIYLDQTAQNVPSVLLQRDSLSSDFSIVLATLNNDYSHCFKKLNNGFDSMESLSDQIMKLYRNFQERGKPLYVDTFDKRHVEQVKRNIYMLYVIGYVREWYAYSEDEVARTVDVLIDISSENHDYYQRDNNLLIRVKKQAQEYYVSLNAEREQIVRTQRAKSIDEVIDVYVNWYYSKYLYNHKELFLDFLDFIESNHDCNSEQITEDIQEYFTLPFVEIKNDEVYYSSLSIVDVGKKVAQGIGRKTMANIERLNSNRYSINLDCFLLFATLKLDSRFDKNRCMRIMKNLSKSQLDDFKNALFQVYDKSTPLAKLNLINNIHLCTKEFGESADKVCSLLYTKVNKDMIYYGIVAQKLNIMFDNGGIL